MGKSGTPADLQAKIHKFAKRIDDVPDKAAGKAALLVKSSIVGFTGPASGGDLRLSGVGRNGAAIGARYKVTNGKALVFATGPFHLIERDTRPGVRARKRRGGRGKARFIGPLSGYYHPGTKGKHPFQKGVEAAKPFVAAPYRSSLHTAMRETF